MQNIRDFLQNTLGKVFKGVDWANVPTGTYVRYILAFIAALNAILTALGINPIDVDESQLYDVVSAILFIVLLFYNTYMDSPTSKEAIESNKYMKQLKEATKTGTTTDTTTSES